jgi:hypothetical protein
MNNNTNIQNNTNNNEKLGKIAFYLSLIFYILLAYFFIKTKGSFSEGDEGIYWAFFFGYCFTIGIPIFISSIVLGIMGLKSGNPIPAKRSLILNAFKIVALLILFSL